MGFQEHKGTVRWKMFFRSNPETVFLALSTPEGRKGFWAESVEQKDGYLHYEFLNGVSDRGKILESVPSKRYRVEYFGWDVIFDLKLDEMSGGTDFLMTCRNVREMDHWEVVAGWVSWLMAMKAAVDHGVDLRNHDPQRTWVDGFADN